MPYIKKEQRETLDKQITELAAAIEKQHTDVDLDPGILNYVVTKLILDLNFRRNYKNFNAVVGALECCKLELYRRGIAPYEDKKIQENGDVYDSRK